MFGSPSAMRVLDKVVQRVLIYEDVQFKVEFKVFQFLMDNFLHQDFSVRNFLEGWKFILREHFRHPASLLRCPPSLRTARLEGMSNKYCLPCCKQGSCCNK